MRIISTQRGFVALISVLIISAVLIVTVLSLAQFGVASRYFLLDLENKTASRLLADACVHTSRLHTYNNQGVAFKATSTVTVGSQTCSILSVLPFGNTSHVEIRAQQGSSFTDYCVKIRHADGVILSWKEVSSFDEDGCVSP